ncbi:hypothetical protein JCM9157_2733 [Halalkalibacter akibai JCM 9157]|uniref:Uncharacterized protein n=1 Tax=Halalkalibacter akibai (strain ATCC 43226 / DSM 21942 / CIP 109018 / JCM 9157 / 1139) TaxID=1236973 RepID=W4QU56_HALA3|nr:hypothetical protein JCM9157_2733 [Halalkalibacter akibai JCM 9157]
MNRKVENSKKYEDFIKDLEVVGEHIGKDCVYTIKGKEHYPTLQYLEVRGVFLPILGGTHSKQSSKRT